MLNTNATVDVVNEVVTENTKETVKEKATSDRKKEKKQHQSNTQGYTIGSIIHFRDAESAAMFKKTEINRFKNNKQNKSDSKAN